MATTWELKHRLFVIRTDDSGTVQSLQYQGSKVAVQDSPAVESAENAEESFTAAELDGATLIALQAAVDAIIASDIQTQVV